MWTAAARGFRTPGGTASSLPVTRTTRDICGKFDYKAGYDQGFNACFQEEKAHPKIKSDGGAHS